MTRSLSNLFKQYNTAEPKKDIRVIDYNPMVEERLAELVKKQSGDGADEEGFKELSLIAGEAQMPKEDPQEAIKRQLEEAEETLRSAKEEAESLLEKARADAGGIRQKAMEDGQKEGYDTGFAQAKAELEEEYSRRKQEVEQLEAGRQAEYDRRLKDLEPKLLDAVLTVVEKVFHVRFDDKKDILLYLVGNTLAEIDGYKEFCIRVRREEKEFLEAHKDEIIAGVGKDITLTFAADLTMEANECVIETDSGMFDCGVGVQLGNLIKDLKALSL